VPTAAADQRRFVEPGRLFKSGQADKTRQDTVRPLDHRQTAVRAISSFDTQGVSHETQHTMTNWTTWLGAVRTWWRPAASVAGRPARILRTEQERRAPPVPAEYLSLYTYLEHRFASIVVLTFEQMEALLGFALPALASTEREWWTDNGARASRHCEAWVGAGRTAAPNLAARTVTFERPAV
jgi:hypothetical protein